MNNKQSFVLYTDYFDSFAALEREERGDLIMAIFEYQRDGVVKTPLSTSCKIAFTFIKSQLERDNEKYQNVVTRNRENGAKGGRPKKKPSGYFENPKNPNGFSKNPKKPKKPDNDNEYDTDIDTENDIIIPPIVPPSGETKLDFSEMFDRFWKAYPQKKAKEQAKKAFNKLKPSEELLGKMLTAIEAQKQSEQWAKDNGAFIPHASTWLNGKRWEDEAPEAHSKFHASKPGDWDFLLEDNKEA